MLKSLPEACLHGVAIAEEPLDKLRATDRRAEDDDAILRCLEISFPNRFRGSRRPVSPDVFAVMRDLVRLKVAPLHPLLRRSAALAYTRRWWSYLAVGAQSAAIDCILGRDQQVWIPHGEPPLATVLADADIAPEPSRLF